MFAADHASESIGIPAGHYSQMVDSPCTNVCALEDGYCVGCGRTVAEITSWQSMSEDERVQVVQAIRDGERAYPKSE